MKVTSNKKLTTKHKFKIGDLVQFDICHVIGIVTDTKIAKEFKPSEEVMDIKVNWIDGTEFWCLEFTLVPISII